MVILTTTQVAERLGIDSSRVRQIAIKHDIGTKINDRTRIFTEEEATMIDAIRQPIGRPKVATLISSPVIYPEPTLAELATSIIGAGVVTDPMFGESRVVNISRGLFDRFTAAMESAGDDTIATAGRELVASADVTDSNVDFPLSYFSRFVERVDGKA